LGFRGRQTSLRRASALRGSWERGTCYRFSNTSSSIGGAEWGRTVPSAGQQAPQNGQGELAEPTKRAAVEMYLSRLTPQEVGVATGSSVVAALASLGIAVEETYAGRILGEWRVAHPAPNRVRRRRGR
jgi:hypothetical protein